MTHATGPQATAVNRYDGLGRVIEALNESADASLERFAYDALGNRTFSSRSVTNPLIGDDGERHTTTDLTGKVRSITSNPANWSRYVYEQYFDYDLAGSAWSESSRERRESGATTYWETRSYYGADGTLRVFNQHTGISQQSDFAGPGARHGQYEEYWYDALGRRILMRTRVDAGCAVASDTGCESVVKRTVWDGDQVLHELRAPGSDTTAASAMEGDGLFVTYTHLAGIDAPVAVLQGWSSMVVPHANWRAVFDSGHAVVGALPRIRWPGSTETLDQAPNTQPHVQWQWYGDVIGGQRDGSGQKYMRNRYYDPAKGTFTQKDPIGLAGGVNLYGYAGGDPVTYSDPFGLKADTGEVQHALGNGCPAIADHCDVDMSRAGPMAAGAAGGLVLVLGGAAVGAEASGLVALRAQYVSRVGALAETGRRMLANGESEEGVATTLHGMRRALGEEYKQLTPFVERMVIYGRNLIKYGDRLGPSVDYLRSQGKSWADIIDSASRTFGH